MTIEDFLNYSLRATGTGSILGSSLIIYMVFSDRKKKLVRPYHRIMLMMSIFDVLQSTSMVISVAAFPYDSGILGAKGNNHTCIAQGFFLILGCAVPLYNSCLNIYYVLTIRYNVSSERFLKLEPILHMISILAPLSIAIICATHESTMPRVALCIPRGKISFWGPTVLFTMSFLICITSMICICWTVVSQAMKMKNYTRFGRKKKTTLPRSRVDDDKIRTIKQALLYFLAFMLTYTFPIIRLCYTRGRAEVEPPKAVVFLTAIFYPLQGVWNFIFYIRPGVQLVMERNPDKSYLGAIRDVIFNSNSVENDSRRLSTKRKVVLSRPSPSSRKVGATPVLTSSLYYDTKENNFSKFSSKKAADDATEDQELFAVTTSVYSGNLHPSDHMYLGNRIPCVIESEGTENEYDIEHQAKARQQPEIRARRLSLVNIASVLDGEDYMNLVSWSFDSSEDTTNKDDLEHQAKVQLPPEMGSPELSDGTYLGNSIPCVTDSGITKIKEDIEQQAKV